jgi:hypothetical protein
MANTITFDGVSYLNDRMFVMEGALIVALSKSITEKKLGKVI